ncbi:T9SS type A sorting domain-containing protein [bacterium]|nr:T9SS type A sorting domain-containing protein [bacterium]
MNKYLVPFVILLIASSAFAQEPCTDSLWAEVSADTVTIHHDGAFYNCCMTIEYELRQLPGDTLIVSEFETGTPCFCMCCFNLFLKLAGFQPGIHFFRVINRDTGEVFGTVPVIVRGGESKSDIRFVSSYQSDCLPLSIQEPEKKELTPFLSVSPNPFNTEATVTVMIPNEVECVVTVSDILGYTVDTLFSGKASEGKLSFNWQAGGKPSGVYFVKVKYGEHSLTKKLILLK